MTKIAIPVKENLLCNQLGECSTFKIYNISNSLMVGKVEDVQGLKSVSALLEWVNESGITDLIVHQIDESLIRYFSETKVNLFIGVPVDKPEALINEYLNGVLQSDVKQISKMINLNLS